jgi:anti-anti-sigma factor
MADIVPVLNSRLDEDLKAVVVALEGELDVFYFKGMQTFFQNWQADLFHPNLLLDLSEVDYVGSSGWAVFAKQAKSARAKQGVVVAFGMNERLKQAWEKIDAKGRIIETAEDYAKAALIVQAHLKKT